MASQGERESVVVEMDVELLESMVQDGDPEQEMLVVEEQELPQLNPEPEMGSGSCTSEAVIEARNGLWFVHGSGCGV